MESKAHTCEQCNACFSKKSNLARHALTHTIGKTLSHVCEVCDSRFANERALIQHVCKFHADLYMCKPCNKTFGSNECLERHMLIHSQVKNYTCTKCDKSFIYKPSLNRHDRHFHQHSSVKLHICKECDKAFYSPAALKRHIGTQLHIRKISKLDSIGCSQLSQLHYIKNKKEHGHDSQTGSNLSRGVIGSGSQEMTHPCGVCQKSFASRRNLSKHMLVHRVENASKTCLENDSYATTDHVMKHVKLEVDPKGQENTRDEGEHSTTSAKEHINYEQNTHACPVCSKTYDTITSLRRHIAVHSEETQNRCDICDEVFHDTIHLVRHMQIHSWETTPFI